MNPNPIKNAEEVVRNYEQEQEHTHIVNQSRKMQKTTTITTTTNAK